MLRLSLLSLVLVLVGPACSSPTPEGGSPDGTAIPKGGRGSATSGEAGAPPPLGKPQQGIATFYEADGTGNCSFDASPGDLLVVAPNKERHYAGSAVCGGCMKVTGARGSVVVRVTDSCPLDTSGDDCGDSGADLDLSAEAFARIDDPDKGKVPVTFELVACEVRGPMAYRFKEGSSQYWTAIQVRNHRVPVAKLEVRKDGTFIPMVREDDNYFVAQDGLGPQPSGFVVRVTAVDGGIVEEFLPRIGDAEVLEGTRQFD